jgi:hypothetical protein
MSTMGKEKRKPTNLELFFLDKKELDEMTSTDAFQSFVKQETYTAIVDAIKRKKKKAQIFRLWNLGFLVTIKEDYYKNALQTILNDYEEQEDYKTCSKITKLINKL